MRAKRARFERIGWRWSTERILLPAPRSDCHMKQARSAYIAAAVGIVVSVGCDTAVAPSSLPSPASTREGRWIQDVDYLAGELARLHPNLFFHTSRADFERSVEEVRRAAPTAADHEMMVGLMRVAAVPGDPHTTLYAWEEFPKAPVRFTRLAAGLYVTSAEAQFAGALGARVLAFDRSAVGDAERAAATVVSHDNDAWLRDQLPRYLILPQVLHALRVTDDPAAMTLLLEDAAGARFNLQLPGTRSPTTLVDVTAVSGAPLPLFRQRVQENYWSTLIEESRTLYLQYNRCQNSAESFESMARRLLQQLDQGQADRLVVDLRLNAGGDSRVDDALISGLTDRPHWRTRGRLFALIGGATFSSALWTAIDLWKAGAILVGTPTGGTPNHYGQVSTFSLPNSRLRVGYSTRHFRLLSDSDPPSLMPEALVEPTIDDLRRGRDPVLEAATSWRGQ
jgi:hypothetical protein